MATAAGTVMTEQQFRVAFAKLQNKHKRWIKEALGNPPDHCNIPKDLWKKIQQEEAAIYLLLMSGVGQASAQVAGQGIERKTRGAVTQADVRLALRKEAYARATWASNQTTGTVQRKVRAIIERLDEDAEAGDVVDRVFTEGRVNRIAVNETVAATTAGTRAVQAAAQNAKVESFLVWRLGTCRHCRVCPLLDRTDEAFWGTVTSGPPIHPNCCCYTTVEFGDRADLVRSGVMKGRYPSEAELISAIRASGWRM